MFVDEEDCVCSFDASFEALCEAAEFVRAGDQPFILVVGVSDEETILKLSSSLVMGDSETFVHACRDCRTVEGE